jgi:large subunit ribosomal protein L18
VNKKNLNRRDKIKFKIRKKVNGTPDKPRLVVYRSLNNIYAQIVDDVNSKTLLTVSTLTKEYADKLKDSKGKISKSKLIGKVVAEKAIASNLKKVVFDRNGYLYHGRVKALADGAREGGLAF